MNAKIHVYILKDKFARPEAEKLTEFVDRTNLTMVETFYTENVPAEEGHLRMDSMLEGFRVTPGESIPRTFWLSDTRNLRGGH